IAGPGLHRNWVTIPHVTNCEDADITDLEAFRVALNKEQEVKVTLLAFLMKACVAALQKFPNFNSSLEGDHLVVKKYWNIAFAADTPQGLVVPVVKDADKKGVFAIAKETSELAAKARDGKLAPGDMQGATFTISSLGGIGGTYFTPIISAPEVAILGVCRAQMRPVWNGSEFNPCLIRPLSSRGPRRPLPRNRHGERRVKNRTPPRAARKAGHSTVTSSCWDRAPADTPPPSGRPTWVSAWC